MYGFNHLHLRALLTAAPYPIRLHRRFNPPLGSFSSTAGIDDFVYVGKEHKICSKDEIEGSIGDLHNTCKWKLRNKKHSYKRKALPPKLQSTNVKRLTCNSVADGGICDVYLVGTTHSCEGSIGDLHNTCKWKLRNKKHSYKRKALPPKLQSTNVKRLTCNSVADGGICDVYLVGTGHCCVKSWREAQSVISFLKPQVVFLELCSDRLDAITGHKEDKVPTMGEMLDMWKKNEDPFWILYKWFYAKLYNRWVDESGGEFRLAYEEAMKYGGKVILGDRPVHITRRRMLAKMSFWKVLFHPYCPDHLLKKTAKDELDITNLYTQEMSRKFPDYAEIIIYERDRYISAKILKVAREHNSVVAIVGRAHLAGIQKYWKQPVDMKQLLDTGNNTFTIGKKLSSIGAMVFHLSISGHMIKKIKWSLSAMYFGDEDDV